MQVLALLEAPTGIEAGALTRLRQAEAGAVWSLHRGGMLRSILFRADGIGAVLLPEGANPDGVETALDGLPMAGDGLPVVDLIPVVPFIGVETLFTSGEDPR